jgi:uncharacterized RDD family membrane protein YckC
MKQMDTTHLVETPEGIDLQAELAGPVVRSMAYAIDLMIRGLVLGLISIVLVFAGNTGMGMILLFSFILEWFYPVLFEIYYHGQTIGKKRMGLIVVNDDLTAISWGSSLIRNLLRFADFLPFAYLGAFISMIFSSRFQRLGDLAAGSLVIYKQKVNTSLELPKCQSQPSPIPLSLEDQTAIIAFTERHNEISDDRQQELADILSEITQQKSDNINYLRGIGNWLLGVK